MPRTLRFLLLALCLGGCATQPTPTIDAFAQNSANNSFESSHRSFRENGLVLPVVHDQQREQQSCGANALASIVNYWRSAGAVNGQAIYAATPPADPRGYNLNELLTLARAHGLAGNAVRLDRAGIIQELEHGRPVLAPVLVPAIFVADRRAPAEDAPVVGLVSRTLVGRVGWTLEQTHLGMVSHYVVVAGYDAHRFVVVEPVRGYRTISFDRLDRYRRPYDNAALVLSGPHPPPATRQKRPAPHREL
ncbi:MAG: hypothetical protein HY054_03015 [Proteobacteria bacterium]|nr:hypothetical protein [Pseudomonadota bacterium]